MNKVIDFATERDHRHAGQTELLAKFDPIECPGCDKLVPPIVVTSDFAVSYECAGPGHRRFMVYTHSSSIVHDKARYIQAMRDGEFGYTGIARSDTKIAFEGGAALLTGRVKLDAVFKTGPRTLDSRFLCVWVKVDRQWRFLAWQSTPVPA